MPGLALMLRFCSSIATRLGFDWLKILNEIEWFLPFFVWKNYSIFLDTNFCHFNHINYFKCEIFLKSVMLISIFSLSHINDFVGLWRSHFSLEIRFSIWHSARYFSRILCSQNAQHSAKYKLIIAKRNARFDFQEAGRKT